MKSEEIKKIRILGANEDHELLSTGMSIQTNELLKEIAFQLALQTELTQKCIERLTQGGG